MSDRPDPPDLARQAEIPGEPGWIRSHAAGLACAVLGLAALVVTLSVHLGGGNAITKIPDVRITAPFMATTVIAMIACLVRREGSYALAVAGVVLAAAAIVLGWALLLAVIAGLTVGVILILSEIM